MEQRGKEVVEQALTALGGDAFRQMKDRVETGRAYAFYNTRMTGMSRARVSAFYLPAPTPLKTGDLYLRERQSFGRKEKNLEDAYYLYREDKAYDVTYRGAKELDETVYSRFKDSSLRNILYMLRVRLGEPGLIIEHRGSEVVDYQHVEIVDFTDSENRVVTVNFQRSTMLPIKQRYLRRNPNNKEQDEEITRFDKYRDVGGMKWPFVWNRERNGEKLFEMFAEEIRVNTGLAASYFELPKGIEIF